MRGEPDFYFDTTTKLLSVNRCSAPDRTSSPTQPPKLALFQNCLQRKNNLRMFQIFPILFQNPCSRKVLLEEEEEDEDEPPASSLEMKALGQVSGGQEEWDTPSVYPAPPSQGAPSFSSERDTPPVSPAPPSQGAPRFSSEHTSHYSQEDLTDGYLWETSVPSVDNVVSGRLEEHGSEPWHGPWDLQKNAGEGGSGSGSMDGSNSKTMRDAEAVVPEMGGGEGSRLLSQPDRFQVGDCSPALSDVKEEASFSLDSLDLSPGTPHPREESESLLKDDTVGSPAQTNLSPWGKLLKMYSKLKGSPAPKLRLKELPEESYQEEEDFIELTVGRIGDPQSFLFDHFRPSDSVGFLEAELKKLLDASMESRLWKEDPSAEFQLLESSEVTLREAGIASGQVLVLEEKDENGLWPWGEIQELPDSLYVS